MSNRLPTVEALRAFGAISVLWMHCIWLGLWNFPRGLGAWFHHGWLGVDLFLIISGFATTRALLEGLNSAQTQPYCGLRACAVLRMKTSCKPNAECETAHMALDTGRTNSTSEIG